MAKKRLNDTHRRILTGLVEEKLNISFAKRIKENENAVAKIDNELTALVKSKTDARDLYVLRKHELTRKHKVGTRVSTVITTDIDTRKWLAFTVTKDLEVPFNSKFSANNMACFTHEELQPFFVRSEKIELMREQLADDMGKVRGTYLALIRSAHTYEDVCHVWSEAKEVHEKIYGVQVGTALVALSQETIATIKQDVEKRQKLVKKAG